MKELLNEKVKDRRGKLTPKKDVFRNYKNGALSFGLYKDG